MSPLRAALYMRLSVESDNSTSIERQREELHALAAREGWHVVEELVDSGMSGRKARAKADRAVEMLRDGEIDVIATYSLDRWGRRGIADLGTLSEVLAARADAARRTGARPGLFVAIRDNIRSDEPSFGLVSAVMSEIARSEGDIISARARSAYVYRKQQHKYTGGVPPFGYRSVPAPDGIGKVLVVSRFEAAVIKAVAKELIFGTKSLSTISREMQGRIFTARSPARAAILKGANPMGLDPGTWRASTIRALWCSDSTLGRSIINDNFVLDEETGLPAEVWPAILDSATVKELRRILRWTPPKHARKRLGYVETGKEKKQPARHATRMLSGVAYCGVCDRKMYITSSGKSNRVYACASRWRGLNDCPSPRIAADALEEFVSGEFLRLAGDLPEMAEEIPDADSREVEIAEIEQQLGVIAAEMRDGNGDIMALAAQMQQLRTARDEIRARRPAKQEFIPHPTGRTLREAFASSEPTEQRAALLQAIDHVRVLPGTQGSRNVSRRVEIIWHS